MHIVGFNIREILCHFVECALPQVKRIGQYIRLSAQGQFLGPVTTPARLKGVPDAALNPHASADRFLNSHLVGRAPSHNAASARIETFCVFTHDDKVNLFRPLILDGRLHTRIELDRPKINVKIQLKPKP